MSGICRDCDAMTTSERCGPCWRRFRTEGTERSFSSPLPPRDPEPPSWEWCRCGAIRNLVTFSGETRCTACWRGAA